ncbi:MAG: hypothetical protein R3B09_08670, partial [Nannocystaceae bacterium]
RIRTALSLLTSNPEVHGHLVDLVEVDIQQLSKHGQYGLAGTVASFRASVAALRGERRVFRGELERAQGDYEQAGMRVHAAFIQMIRERIAPASPKATSSAEVYLRLQGIAKPASHARIYAPGIARLLVRPADR